MKKAKYEFVYGRKKDDNIELYVYIDRKTKAYLSTKIKVKPQYWDDKKKAIRGSMPNSDYYNAYLQQFRNKIEQIEMECLIKGVPFNKEVLKNALDTGKPIEKNTPAPGRLADFVREKIETETAQKKFAPGTEKAMRSFCNIVDDFDKECGEITFANFDKDKLTQLDIWLKARYAPETARKKITYVKKYTDMAVKADKMPDNPFDDFQITRLKTEQKRDSLTAEELRRIETLAESGELPDDLQLVADRFLFSCYCGLRISDNADLRKTDVFDAVDEDGTIVDRLTIKTKTRVILPLHKLFDGKPERIVRKYMGTTLDEFVFPQLSDQKTNIKLKTLAALAGLRNLQLTFHIARHTCATMLAEKTGNPFTIMQILGHSDIKTSMEYIHNSYRAVVNSLSNVNW